jgi:uncharacterized damage-inducible protein DinB
MTDSEELLRYIDRIRERTLRVAACVPADKVDWTYAEGKFTIGDILRHLASIERWMFAENAALRPSRYPGHGPELADGLEAITAYMGQMHAESMAIFCTADMEAKTATPGGAELRVSKWLRSMVEHEIHHRGQLYMYLGMLGVSAPPLYGLTEEEVKARSAAAGLGVPAVRPAHR